MANFGAVEALDLHLLTLNTLVWAALGDVTELVTVAALRDATVHDIPSISKTSHVVLGRGWPARGELWAGGLVASLEGDDIGAVPLALKVADGLCVGNRLFLGDEVKVEAGSTQLPFHVDKGQVRHGASVAVERLDMFISV